VLDTAGDSYHLLLREILMLLRTSLAVLYTIFAFAPSLLLGIMEA